jgi:glycosyltransferase involved in cell wall biosynthesis
MKVSVVIPTRNRSAWLALTLRSVLRQQHDDLEAIVVDDGSIDDTPEMLAAVPDGRLRIVRHDSPLGVSVSRNDGAAKSDAAWLAFVDDDDLWAPDKLSSQLNAAVAAGSAWVYTGAVTIDEHSTIVGGRPPPPPEVVSRLIPRYNVIPGGGSNVIVQRDEFERVGPFDTRLKNTEDWDMWIRLSDRGAPACVPRPLLGYRVHTRNASLDVAAIFEGITLIEARHGTRVDRGVLHRWIAETSLRTGDRRSALKHMAIAALRGQAMNVGGDAARIVRRNLDRGRGGSVADSGPDRVWIDEAQTWLVELLSAGAEGVATAVGG